MFSNQKESGPETHSYQAVKYESLDDADFPSPKPPRDTALRFKIVPFAAGIATTLILSLLLFFFKNIFTHNSHYALDTVPEEDWNHCGRSSSVAIEKGCVMEPLFYGWMPPQCVFSDLSSRFPVFEDRTWYSDTNLTIAIPSEDLWHGEHIRIYTRRYHTEHCLFQWRKLQYGMHNRVEFLDNKTVSLHHSGHCADEYSNGFYETEDAVNDVELGFYRCRKTVW